MLFHKSLITKSLVLLRYLFMAAHHLYCYPASFVWLFLLTPLKYFQPAVFWNLVNTLLSLLHTMGTWYTWSTGYGVVELGDDISPCYDDRTLVLINHQTAGDILILWDILHSRPKMLHNSFWIMNEEFKYAPFGIMALIRGDFFIPIGRKKREEGLIKLKQHLKKWFLPKKQKMIILFPEGGFLRKRRIKSQKYALEHNLPVLEHVCLPRVGAMQAIVDVCVAKTSDKGNSNKDDHLHGDNLLKWVLDVTIAYPQGVPMDLTTVGHGTRKPFHTTVLYRLFPAHDLSTDPEKVTEWLFERWLEKEKILSTYYSTDNIPVEKFCSNPVPPRLSTQDPLKHMLIHFFFIISTFAFYRLFSFMVTPNLLLVLAIYLVFLTLKIKKII